MAIFLLSLLLSCLFLISADEPFDVRQHLATTTGYGVAKNSDMDSFVPSSIPDGCTAIHLNLVARHGTRGPTKKRIEELEQLSVHLAALLNNTKDEAEKCCVSMQNIPAWLQGWRSPWEGKRKGEELLNKGEDELYLLGNRIRERFPKLFNEEYHPDIFTIRSTQVPRVSASAVAFGLGLFSGKGSLGPGRVRAFSVISESRASDVVLRFFDTCETYKKYRENQEPVISKLKEPILNEVASELVRRYQLNFTRKDVASLWFLCKQEASLFDITDQACSLFNSSEVSLLEWMDDLEGFLLNGYGKSVNYRMGIPLLHDVIQSVEQAIVAKEGNHTPGTFEKARFRFAHAETVAPFVCLLGLFLKESELELIHSEQPLNLPPKPPRKRNWRGSIIAPFAGNTMLVLYGCPHFAETMASEVYRNKYFVQVLHNEVPVPIPGCGNSDFCPFDIFKERVVNPHLKHDFESVCSM